MAKKKNDGATAVADDGAAPEAPVSEDEARRRRLVTLARTLPKEETEREALREAYLAAKAAREEGTKKLAEAEAAAHRAWRTKADRIAAVGGPAWARSLLVGQAVPHRLRSERDAAHDRAERSRVIITDMRRRLRDFDAQEQRIREAIPAGATLDRELEVHRARRTNVEARLADAEGELREAERDEERLVAEIERLEAAALRL